MATGPVKENLELESDSDMEFEKPDDGRIKVLEYLKNEFVQRVQEGNGTSRKEKRLEIKNSIENNFYDARKILLIIEELMAVTDKIMDPHNLTKEIIKMLGNSLRASAAAPIPSNFQDINLPICSTSSLAENHMDNQYYTVVQQKMENNTEYFRNTNTDMNAEDVDQEIFGSFSDIDREDNDHETEIFSLEEELASLEREKRSRIQKQKAAIIEIFCEEILFKNRTKTKIPVNIMVQKLNDIQFIIKKIYALQLGARNYKQMMENEYSNNVELSEAQEEEILELRKQLRVEKQMAKSRQKELQNQLNAERNAAEFLSTSFRSQIKKKQYLEKQLENRKKSCPEYDEQYAATSNNLKVHQKNLTTAEETLFQLERKIHRKTFDLMFWKSTCATHLQKAISVGQQCKHDATILTSDDVKKTTLLNLCRYLLEEKRVYLKQLRNAGAKIKPEDDNSDEEIKKMEFEKRQVSRILPAVYRTIYHWECLRESQVNAEATEKWKDNGNEANSVAGRNTWKEQCRSGIKARKRGE